MTGFELSLPESLKRRYRLTRVLGHGGMGVVAAAHDTDLDRPVAIKLILNPSDDSSMLSRFRREGEMLARLQHPNMLRVFDLGDDPSGLYLVTELLEGLPLDRLPEGEDPLPLMLQAGAALDAIHAEGLLHRDVKPANLFKTPQGRVVLLDFGLMLDPEVTRLTATGSLVGTPAFLAPELLKAGTATPATDWYAWGATLYWLLERRPLRNHEDLAKMFAGTEVEPLPFFVIPPDSEGARLVLATTHPDPVRRMKGLSAVETALSRAPPSPTETRSPTRAVLPLLFLAVVLSQLWTAPPNLARPASPTPKIAARNQWEPWLEALDQELASVPTPEFPVDPVRLHTLRARRPMLERLLQMSASEDPWSSPPQAVAARVAQVDHRLSRLGLPQICAPVPPRRDLARDTQAFSGYEPKLRARALGTQRIYRWLDKDLAARKRLLKEASEALPVDRWRHMAAALSGIETLAEDAIRDPNTRAAVSEWLRPSAERLRRYILEAPRLLDDPSLTQEQRIALGFRFRAGIQLSEVFFWSHVPFLDATNLLGPKPETAQAWFFRGLVLEKMIVVRRAARVALDDLEFSREQAWTRAVASVPDGEGAGANLRASVAAAAALQVTRFGRIDEGLARLHPHFSTLLRSDRWDLIGKLTVSLGPTWIERSSSDLVRREARGVLRWFRDRPEELEKANLWGPVEEQLEKLARVFPDKDP